MKKLCYTAVLVMLLAPAVLVAQPQDIDPGQLGVDAAQQRLQQVSVSRFEDPGFWRVSMSLDSGVITYRRLEGGPMDAEPIEAEVEAGIDEQNRYVLGVKAEFFRRRATNIFVEAERPIPIPGVAKTLSVWVVGRNRNHRLSAVLNDYFGNLVVLPMGEMNFSGWREVEVAIPPSIPQEDMYIGGDRGIQFVGFLIEPALMQTYGSYYVYFDDMRVVTDLFAEEVRDPDDMVDSW